MSKIQNASLLKDHQWHDLCIKGAQESSKQTATSIEQVDLRYLSLGNYFHIEKKSKQQIFNSQIYYFNHLKLIPFAFHLNFDRFLNRNSITSQQNASTIFSSISQNQALENILKYNKSKEFLTSYTGFTRKMTNSLFLLINCQQAAESQNHKNNLKLKISFLNHQGQILHVCSNLDCKNVEKVNKITKKHFSCLNTIVVLLNKSLPLQQSEQILKTLIQKSEDISKIILFSKTKPNPQTVESLKESNEIIVGQCASQCLIFENARGIKDLNIKVINSVQGWPQDELVDSLVQRGIQMLEIEDFVYGKMIRGEVIPAEMVYRNEWMISVTSLIFNILTSAKRNLISSIDQPSVREEVQSKIYNLFVASLSRMDQQNRQAKTFPEVKRARGAEQMRMNECENKCFPYLFETSKKCLVCKESKPKFGCRECSARYKREIHLCVSGCFKLFHLETLKYISNQISLTGVASRTILSPSMDPIATLYSPSLAGSLPSVPKFYLKSSSTVSNNKNNRNNNQSILNHQSLTQNQLLHRRFKRKQIKKIAKSLSKQHFLIQNKYNHRPVYKFVHSTLDTQHPSPTSVTEARKPSPWKDRKKQQSTTVNREPSSFTKQ